MKKILLSENKKFFKANLHTHSTVSDGVLTPEELKEVYKSMGYSIVAYTDHDVLVPHPELTDENFLALNGFEMEFNNAPHLDFHYELVKSTHFCSIALDPENLVQPCWNLAEVPTPSRKSVKDVKFDPTLPPFIRKSTPECISEAMKICREKGFFVTYNHPNWSIDDYNDYTNYNNMHAMEICNWVSYLCGLNDLNNEREYDDMLRAGKRIYCLATDDCHAKEHCGGGFTMINAEKLEYKTVTQALLDGNFYASTGPEIFNLWFEDGILHVECSKAKRIALGTMVRNGGCVMANDGEYLTSADFKIDKRHTYVRISITDENGNMAHTNAYFTDELFA